MNLRKIITVLFLVIAVLLSTHAQENLTTINQENITEEEALEFMQEVLWFCNYDYYNYKNPNEKLLAFFPDSIAAILQTKNKLFAHYELNGAILYKMDLPWIEVQSTNGIDSRNWRKIRRFKLTKKEGQLYLIPAFKNDFDFPTVTPWLEDRDIDIRKPTAEELKIQKEDLYNYLEQTYTKANLEQWSDKDITGDWIIDSIFFIENGVKDGTPNGVNFLFLEDGTFYNYSQLFLFFGEDWLLYPGWWEVWYNKLIISQGAKIELFNLENRTAHTISYSQSSKGDSMVWLLSNLPYAEAPPTPMPIEHPDVDVILQPTYDRIFPFYQERAIIKKGDKYGMIDYEGKETIAPVFDEIKAFYKRKTSFAKKDGQWFKIDLDGKIVDSLAFVDVMDVLGRYLLAKGENEKIGMVDENGKVIIPYKYDFIIPERKRGYKVYLEGKLGLLDKNCEILLPTIFDEISYGITAKEDSISLKFEGKWGVWSIAADSFIIAPKYDYIFKGPDYFQVKTDGKQILIDRNTLKPVPTPTYELVDFLWNGQFRVKKEGKVGVVDWNDQVIIPIIYDELGFIDRKRPLIQAKKNGLWGIIDKSGKYILPFKYEEIWFANEEDKFKVKKNDKWGIVNQKDSVLIPIQYDYLSSPSKHYSGGEEIWLEFSKNNKYGYLNLKDEVVIPPMYDYLLDFNASGFAEAERNGKRGIINKENQIVLPFLFDSIIERSDTPVMIVNYEGFYGLVKKLTNH